MSINTGKVLAGGLGAGVVLNVMDFVANMLMTSDFAENASRLGLDAATMQAAGTVATWVVIDLLMGLVLVFVYAAIRPRFGAGPKTAVLAGSIIWFAVSIIVFGFATMGMIDMPLYWKSTFISLVNVLVGVTVGAWIYRES